MNKKYFSQDLDHQYLHLESQSSYLQRLNHPPFFLTLGHLFIIF